MPIGSRRLSIAGAALLVVAGVGCFTDPINRPPTVGAIQPVGSIVRGQDDSFTTTAADPDQDAATLTLTWAYVAGTCPDAAGRASWPPGEQTRAQTFVVPAAVTLSPFCVIAFATDRYGAVASTALGVQPDDRPPAARIQINSPARADSYALFSDFNLSAIASDPEGDAITLQWTLDYKPVGSTAAIGDCLQGGSAAACFHADLQGIYTVSLMVSDSFGMHASDALTLSVAGDRLPCIAVSTPDYLSPMLVHDLCQPSTTDPTKCTMTPDSFVIDRVDDDGAPYPKGPYGEAHFTWYFAMGDDPLAFQDNDFPSFDVVGVSIRPGDTAHVRVEVTDGTPAAVSALFGCGDAPVCAARPGCFQRVTWSIEYQ